jgi:ATP-dependent RNA helicase RhlE
MARTAWRAGWFRSGWSATQIHGDRSQAQRNQALRSFSEGRHRVLVATDVAARGIDVANVAHVVNFDMPKVAEDFVHRVGRTGRASAHGVASTFAVRRSAATCARSSARCQSR